MIYCSELKDQNFISNLKFHLNSCLQFDILEKFFLNKINPRFRKIFVRNKTNSTGSFEENDFGIFTSA